LHPKVRVADQTVKERVMPRAKRDEYKKRLDPYDPKTGATANDEPLDTSERSSPGSGEELEGEAADLQPDDVEQGDTAR
jgi:hypothetical protein